MNTVTEVTLALQGINILCQLMMLGQLETHIVKRVNLDFYFAYTCKSTLNGLTLESIFMTLWVGNEHIEYSYH